MKNRQAFTLIELLVVILIIGILAAVALPQYQMAVLKSRFTQAKAVVNALAQAQEVYYLANGTYSHSYDDLDIDTPAYKEETENISDGINRPHRIFSWGACTLWQVDVVSCRVGDVLYEKYYDHSAKPGVTLCSVYNTDLSSNENKLCKSETGKTAPETTGDNYVTWVYP